MIKANDFEMGANNIFVDLGFDNPEQELLKAQLAHYVHKAIKEQKLTQTQAADKIGITQPDISKLIHGHYSRFTAERLFNFLNRLDYDIDIRIKKAKSHEAHINIA